MPTIEQWAASHPTGQCVMNLSTGTVGDVLAVHAPGSYTSPANGSKVLGWVLELKDGSSFSLREDDDPAETWIDLTPKVSQYAQQVAEMLSHALFGLVKMGAAMGLDQRTAFLVLCMVLTKNAATTRQAAMNQSGAA